MKQRVREKERVKKSERELLFSLATSRLIKFSKLRRGGGFNFSSAHAWRILEDIEREREAAEEAQQGFLQNSCGGG